MSKARKTARRSRPLKLAYFVERPFTSIRIEGYDRDGRLVTFEADLCDGTITMNGHCRFF